MQVRSLYPLVFPMKLFPQFPSVCQPLLCFPVVFIFWPSCPLYKVPEFFELQNYPSDLSHINNYLTSGNFFNLPPHVAFDIFRFPWGLFSVGLVGDFIWFKARDVQNWVDLPARPDIQSEYPITHLSHTLNKPYSLRVRFFVGRLIRMFLAFNITQLPI